ncbi:MAG: hypothetical protein MUC88_24065 [Planctomycetes bacterium]|jgi:hypothetical protein|nr:hypothetical protein [Planctomycetota bacterium]
MRTRTCAALSCLVILSALVLGGCAKKANQSPSATGAGTTASVNVTADAEKPVAEVQTQAQKMSVADLRATALQYKQAIAEQQTNLQKLVAQVKEIPLAEALGEKAKSLKTEAQKIESSLKALTERFQVYVNQLKEKGGDVSGLTS